MKLEAVSVCVNYGDILAEVAPHNRPLLDRWIVATTAADEETREVCRKNSIETILCEDFYRDGAKFNKARGINAALQQLSGDGFVVHSDSDIAFPFDMRECLKDADITKGNIYGCLRVCVPGWDCWQKTKQQGLYSRYQGWLTEYRDRAAGTYLGGQPCGPETGYTPIGFFQLWHGSETFRWGSPRKFYPIHHNGAARTDTQFASLWDRKNRIMIPELLVFHLEHEEAKNQMGVNWNGRKSPRFAPVSMSPVGAAYK